MAQDFDSYASDVNLGLRMLGAPEATTDEIRDQYNTDTDTDEAAEAIVHYRELKARQHAVGEA